MSSRTALHTEICDLLGCRYPILQAGMGGVARSELVAAVSEAGGYGFLGMVRERPELIAGEIDAVRGCTERNFGVNLIPAATGPELFNAELDVCLDLGVHSICYFWHVDEEAVMKAKAAGCLVLYQVGSVRDAIAAERAGADAIIAQGFEAGGHVHGRVTSLVLIPQIVRAVSVPVIASGGFASGAALIAALALGGAGIHSGTAFVATKESFAHRYHKDRLVTATSEDTIHTDAFAINWPVNSPVRVLANSVTESLQGRYYGHSPDALPKIEIGREGDRPIYRQSTDSPLRITEGAFEEMALFAGQVAGSITSCVGARDLIAQIMSEAAETLDGLSMPRKELAQ